MGRLLMICLLLPFFAKSQLFGFFPPPIISHGSITFTYTGAVQTWTVPSGVTSLSVDAYGAQGGSSTAAGGLGGRVQTSLTVTSGAVLNIVVGGQPTTNAAVYGYAGAGGGNNANTSTAGKAGGGLSGIFSNVGITQAASYVIAAGGGGSTAGYAGAAAGAPNGSNGAQGNYSGKSEGGKGATQSAGGAAGSSIDPQTTAPTAGIAINGGNGGAVNTSTWGGGGGGGGGYFGGGGGGGGGASIGAGGGGSSYVNVTYASSTTYTSGNRSGNGQIIITY